MSAAPQTEEVPKRRERRIGGYDIAALVGQSPYGGPIDVFRRIVERENKETTKAMKRGLYLEPAIRQMYVDETGAELRKLEERIIYSERYPFMVASVDDLSVRNGSLRLVDYKAPHPELHHRWGESGTDEVDSTSLIQAQWYMANEKVDTHLADVVPYFGGDDLRIYTIRRDQELIEMLLDVAGRFWRDHVMTGKPPPADATARYEEWIEKKYPLNRGTMVDADFELEGWADQLFAAREQIKAAEKLEQEARNHLVEAIGGADGIEGATWRATWKLIKGRVTVDHDAILREAGVPEELIQRHTNIGAGYRQFRPTIKKPKKEAK